MTQVMKGVRVLEVAQYTFVPAAGAILADWGADVLKIEHPERGDNQRGFVNIGGVRVNPMRSAFVEHPNRGKRSVGVDISRPEGMEIIYELAKHSDVFLTNYRPSQRQRMKFDIDISAPPTRKSSMRAAVRMEIRDLSATLAATTAPPSGTAAASQPR